MGNKYNNIFADVKRYLEKNDQNGTELSVKFPFRKRFEHIWRVYIWANRLLDKMNNEKVNRNLVSIAALFHDIGYAVSTDSKKHAENSAKIFEEYSKNMDLKNDDKEYIKYLIRNHSNKEMMEDANIPIELLILMEADLMDETGALSIIWDCMAEGSQNEQSFIKTYEHIKEKSYKIVDKNPMKTKFGKEIWEKKQKLVKEFVEQLFSDLCNDNI